ncbi:hypothetical protein K438DRAFT_2111783 [Mycena galopus ATCC 62051]|nr:hypothetical protein K438DRAFT_2111783 [Mycena galopus ATCC 62051]
MAFKPQRNRTASAKVSDANNVEAPSAAHQKNLANLIAKLRKLADQLLETVPEATDTDNKIYRIITQVHGLDDGSVQSTFVRRFDFLFAEKSRNADGRLTHVRRGELGMKSVIQYLDFIHWESDPDLCMLAIERLQRIIAELEHLRYSIISSLFTSPHPSSVTPSQQSQRPTKKRKLDDKTADRIFEAMMNGKKKGKKKKSKKVANDDESDPEYRPRRPRSTLSEDSKDDFDNDELDEAATPESSRKGKLLVVHSDEGSDNDTPLPKSTKSKGSAAPPPKASVIEISEESDDKPDFICFHSQMADQLTKQVKLVFFDLTPNAFIHFSQHAVLDEAAHLPDGFWTEAIHTTILASPALSSSEISHAMKPFNANNTSPKSCIPIGSK